MMQAPDAPRSRFTYGKLGNGRVIRLFKLDPGAPGRATGFQLKTFWLQEAPAYYALSCAWGTSERAASIICNGECLPVTGSLKAGVDELLGTAALAGGWIWIDQICINQDDAEERSHQVQLMRHIYKGALRTVVWLGPSAEPEDEVFALAEKIHAVCQVEEFSSLYPWSHVRRLDVAEVPRIPYQALGFPPLTAGIWKGLLRLLGRPWFRRLWVIQEVALSAKPPILVHCARPRDLRHLLAATSLISRDLRFHHLTTRPLEAGLMDMLGTKYPLSLSIYLDTSTLAATDPRDYVYSVLGLAAETSIPSDLWPAALVPDYSLPAGELYRRVTAYMVSDSRSLFILHRVFWGDPRAQATPLETADGAGLPSWVVRFDRLVLPISVSTHWDVDGDRLRPNHATTASGGRAAVVRHSDAHPRILGLRGASITKIRFVSPVPPEGQLAEPLRLFRWVAEVSRNLRPDDWLLRAWAEHLGVAVPPMAGLEALERFLAVWLEVVDREIPSSEFLQYKSLRMQAYFGKSQSAAEEINRSHPTMRTLEAVASNRDLQLFVTEDDRVGLGRPTVQTGDLVCVLYGGGMPFVLRPAGTQHILVGPCIAQGWMRGEAIAMVDAGLLEERWFDLI